MKRFLALCAAAALTVALSPRAGWSTDKNPTVADAAIDLAIPDSPALTALGLGPNLVERPGSPREFAASMLHGIDTNGNVQTGISIDAAPYLWYRGREMTLSEYQQRYLLRFLSRTQLSFAATHGDSAEDEGTEFALGLRVTPWDEGDPRMDEELGECLRDAVLDIEIGIQGKADALMADRSVLETQKERIERRINGEKKNGDREKLDVLDEILDDINGKIKMLDKQREQTVTPNFSEMNARSTAAITDCRKKRYYRTALWNRPGWSLGVAPTFTSATGAEDDLESSGTALWTSLAFNLWDLGQLVLHARYRNNETAPDPSVAGRFIQQDSFRAGGRVRFGSPGLNFNLEGVHVTENRKGYRGDDKKIQYGAGMEYRIADDLWFVFTAGSEAYDNKEDNLIMLASLRWAFTPEPAGKY